MAGGIKKFLDFIKLGADDEDLYDDDMYEEEEDVEPISRNTSRRRTYTEERTATTERSRRTTQTDASDNSGASAKREYSRTFDRNSSGKVVPMKTVRGMEVSIQKPTSFEDSEEICDMLLKGRAVVVNLEGFDSGDAQRIIDLLYGCIYAIGGKLNQISKYIFIFSPDNIDVMGDITFDVNGVPTFNKEF